MASLPIRRIPIGLGFACCAVVASANAASLNDLLNQKDIKPEAVARAVSDFAFELAPKVQEPDAFLQRKRGDCADFSKLAATVLSQHGYTTKLVVVMMSQQTHVVCYVKEAGGFLDYNHRADAHPVIPSNGSLEDIAGKVAGDFRSQWRLASFFRYHGADTEFLDTVFAISPAAQTQPAKRAKRRSDSSGDVAIQAVIR
ncbi:MAG TPA: transglutaminase domain-containing protein [Verrucomicrobiae bacterium]|jgi:hypothetical protein